MSPTPSSAAFVIVRLSTLSPPAAVPLLPTFASRCSIALVPAIHHLCILRPPISIPTEPPRFSCSHIWTYFELLCAFNYQLEWTQILSTFQCFKLSHFFLTVLFGLLLSESCRNPPECTTKLLAIKVIELLSMMPRVSSRRPCQGHCKGRPKFCCSLCYYSAQYICPLENMWDISFGLRDISRGHRNKTRFMLLYYSYR